MDDAPVLKCPVCYGRGYEHCDCWPGDCICSEGDSECEACFGSGFVDFPDPADEIFEEQDLDPDRLREDRDERRRLEREDAHG